MESIDSDIISEYQKEWYKYHIGCDYCDKIFRYLNNNWIAKCIQESRNKLGGLYHGLNSKEVYLVIILCMMIWKDYVFMPLKDRLNRQMLDLVTRERDGESINQAKISKVVISYCNKLIFFFLPYLIVIILLLDSATWNHQQK